MSLTEIYPSSVSDVDQEPWLRWSPNKLASIFNAIYDLKLTMAKSPNPKKAPSRELLGMIVQIAVNALDVV